MTDHDPLCDWEPIKVQCQCDLIAKVRAAEHWERLDRIIEAGRVANYAKQELLADLRAKVLELPPHGAGEQMFVWRDDVLALLQENP